MRRPFTSKENKRRKSEKEQHKLIALRNKNYSSLAEAHASTTKNAMTP